MAVQKVLHGSDSHSALHFAGPAAQLPIDLVHLGVFLGQDAALQFQILKLLVLLLVLVAEDVRELRCLFGDFGQQFLVVAVRAVVELLQLQLQLRLQLLLLVDTSFEVVDGRLRGVVGTSMPSTCSLTVVVTPSLSLLSVPVRFMVNSKLLIL